MQDSRRRWNLLGLVALALIPATVYLAVQVPDLTLAGALLLLLCEIVVVAASTTLWAAIITAMAAFLLTNWFLVPPYRTLFVASTDDVIVLLVFLGSATLASWAVRATLASQHRAHLAQFEASQLRQSVSTPASEAEPVEILRRLAQVFHLVDVALVAPDGRQLARVVTDSDGDDVRVVDAGLTDGHRLVGHGVPTFGYDAQLLVSMGNAALRGFEARGLAEEAARVGALEELDRDRSALLASVGHDLRTPIATITVAAGALASDTPMSAEVRRGLTATIVESAHNLDRLVTNLLDMSRLEAGKVVAHVVATDVDEVVAAALLSVNSPEVDLAIPDDLPAVSADPVLLERVLANLIINAVRHGRAPVHVRAHATDATVDIDVLDHGPGLSTEEQQRLFEPFAVSGDRTPTGSGLGLAIAMRFCQAMGADLVPRHTPEGFVMTVRVGRSR